MFRLGLGIAAGILTYSVFVAAVAVTMQFFWPDQSVAGVGTEFSTLILFRRLFSGWIAVFVSGMIATIVSQRGDFGALVNGIAIQLIFTGVHLANWSLFPAWYHIALLSILIPLSWFGGKVVTSYTKSRSGKRNVSGT